MDRIGVASRRASIHRPEAGRRAGGRTQHTRGPGRPARRPHL